MPEPLTAVRLQLKAPVVFYECLDCGDTGFCPAGARICAICAGDGKDGQLCKLNAKQIVNLRKELARLRDFENGVHQALNSGDGSYHP